MEFKLINPTSENGFIQAIEFNFDELKTELSARLEKYENLTYTEDAIKTAKEDRANLNKFKEAIDKRRKEIKKLCLKPYEEFEKRIKELVFLVDKPVMAIDTQIKNFELQKAEAKKADIENFYNSIIEDFSDILPIEKIFNKKWLNATYKMSEIEKEIAETISDVKAKLEIINGLKLEADIALQVKNKYLATLDFVEAMQEKEGLEKLKTLIEAREKQHKEEQKQTTKTHQVNEDKKEANEICKEPQKIYYRKFWVKGNKAKLVALGEFLRENNIEYGGIE